MTRKITVLATDFKPMLGGVAEYSFQLAEKLNAKGILDQVFTPNIQNETYTFKVAAPKEFSWMKSFKNKNFLKRKLYSLIYISQLKLMEIWQIKNWLYHNQRPFIIVNWIISPISKRWITALNLFHFPYAIILHGKDIIVASQNESQWFTDISTKAKLIIFNSQATAILFGKLQPGIEKKSYILYPSLDINYLRQLNLNSLEDLGQLFNYDLKGKLVISSVCRLIKRKGIDLAIRSLEPILKRNKDIIYIIMGNGEEYQPLKSLIVSLNLDSQVLLVGEFNDTVKFSLLNTSSIFIMPNHYQNGNDFEGFGISFLEASYFKNVVIGGRNGGVTEAIKDGHSGFLVDTNSKDAIESISKVINNLLDNSNLINQMAEFGHQYVVDNFQSTHAIDAFSEYIQDYLLQ